VLAGQIEEVLTRFTSPYKTGPAYVLCKFIGWRGWTNNTGSDFNAVLASREVMLTGSDDSLYVLARTGITRFSAQ